MNEPKTELGKFLLRTQIRDNLSKREFASKLHCSADTITRMIDAGEQPTIKFLRSVSSYTGTGLLALLQMAFPDEIKQPAADFMVMAQQIDSLPEPQRTIVIDLIRAALKSSGNSGNKGKVSKGDQGKR